MTPFKGIQIPESGNFCLWNLESWVLESGIKLNKSGIPLMIDWNPKSGIQIPLTEIRNPWRGSRIQYCLGFSYVGRDIRKKFKGVVHSNEITSSRFCLNVLKLMIWTGSIYFNANLTFSFACLSKNNPKVSPFKLWTNFFVERKLLCIILYHLPHPRAWPTSKLYYFGGVARSHARADTSSRGFVAFLRVLSRL